MPAIVGYWRQGSPASNARLTRKMSSVLAAIVRVSVPPHPHCLLGDIDMFNVKCVGADDFLSGLAGMPRQIPYALANGLNATGRRVKDAELSAMPEVFDRPTKFTLNSLQLTIARAPAGPMEVSVWFKGAANHYLLSQVEGGPRTLKAFETMFGRKFMKDEYLVPGAAADDLGLIDANGNFKRGELIRLLSYFSTWSEQGYKSNSTDKSRARMAKMGRTPSGYRTINGKVYFISLGKGHLVGVGQGWTRGRDQHLPAGIWQKSGIHGSIVRPVLMVVSKPEYRKLYDFYGIAQKIVDNYSRSDMEASINKEAERQLKYMK